MFLEEFYEKEENRNLSNAPNEPINLNNINFEIPLNSYKKIKRKEEKNNNTLWINNIIKFK